MYNSDTFFHLTIAGRFGLAILSICLSIVLLFIFMKISSRFPLAVKIGIAIVLFWLFVWLSPQVYYAYYWFLFDNLPVQSVIQFPPGPKELLQLMTFSNNQNLSDHSKGLLFWVMIGAAIWKTFRRTKN
ncbi:MAG: hypothetical protein AAF217_08245 [Pseudomonadota bacterium]